MAIKCPHCSSENTDTSNFCSHCAAPLSSQEASFTKTLQTPTKKLALNSVFADRYEILEELGKGGMGQVYRVKDQTLDEEMALKILKPEIAQDKEIIERFKNELKLARKIGHKNICRMYDLNEEGETPYITMEYVKGDDLKTIIKERGRLTEKEALSIAKQVCEGLAAAHELGVIHRDLKPQNIMLDEKGSAKVMDFGIARSVDTSGVTQSGVMIGTPDYMSPEQAEGEEADQRSDIYALGVILYEIVTGNVPFTGDTALSVALKHKTKMPPDPTKLNPDISESLSRLILICMEKERPRRYQTAEALLDDLTNIEDGLPLGTKIRPRQKTFLTSLIRNKIFIPAAAVILAIAAIGVWQLSQKKAPAIPKIENSIAVISFENLTGDQSLDMLQRVIPHLLITSLENTGFFHVASWERLRDVMKQMGKEDIETIDEEMGFDICRREGIEAVVRGTVMKLGDLLVTDVKVLNVETKELIQSARSEGEGTDSLIKTQIDELSRNIALGVGLSERRVQSEKIQLADVTTSSFEAYDYYIKGMEAKDKYYYSDARDFFKKAIELDPEFAIAYLYLSDMNSKLRNFELAHDQLKTAKAFSDKAPEKERLYIEAAYSSSVANNNDLFRESLNAIIEKYPKENEPYYHLGLTYKNYEPTRAIELFNKVLELDSNYGLALNELAYTHVILGEFDRAIEYFKRYSVVSPGDANPLDSLAELYFETGRLEESAAKYKEAVEVKPDFFNSLRNGAYVYTVLEDYEAALDFIQRLITTAPSPAIRAEGYWIQGFLNYWLGRLDQAISDFRVSMELERAAKITSLHSRNYYMAMWIFMEKGEYNLGRKAQTDMLDRTKDESGNLSPYWAARSLYYQGLLDLEEGNIESAQSKMKEMNDSLPQVDRNIARVKHRLLLLNAEIFLAEGKFEDAVALCEKELFEHKTGWNNNFNFNIPLYADNSDVLARAYQGAGEIDSAIAEYERLMTIDPEDPDDRFPIPPRYHYRIARLYEEKAWTGKAIEHYEKFLDYWKDADPSFFEVEDARRRLAELRVPSPVSPAQIPCP